MTREYDLYACGIGCTVSESTGRTLIKGTECGQIELNLGKKYRVIDVEGKMYVEALTEIGMDDSGATYIIIDNKKVRVHSIIFIALEE